MMPMRPPRSALLRLAASTLALALSLVAAPAAADRRETPPGTGERHAFEAGPVAGVLHLPPSGAARPAPAVILLHDSLGHDPRGARYADQLLGAGLVVLDIARHDDTPEAIRHAVAALSAHPRVQGAPTGLLGFGAGARLAMRLPEGIAARGLLYPGCATLPALAEAAPPGPVLLLHGEDDPANAPESCAAAAATLARGRHAIRLIGYADAGYAWDYPAYGHERRMRLPPPEGGERIPVEPWPELVTLSATTVARFFATTLVTMPR